jgi:hypothetical protein
VNDVTTIGGNAIDIGALSDQKRAEKIQIKVLAANLTAQTLARTDGPSDMYIADILGVYERFLTVD